MDNEIILPGYWQVKNGFATAYTGVVEIKKGLETVIALHNLPVSSSVEAMQAVGNLITALENAESVLNDKKLYR